jgi:hypothetical protein
MDNVPRSVRDAFRGLDPYKLDLSVTPTNRGKCVTVAAWCHVAPDQNAKGREYGAPNEAP